MKLKTFMLIVACTVISHLTQAQLKSTPFCPPFSVDILDGNVNKLYAESPWGDIKFRLPCFTEAIPEPSTNGCAGIFFKDRGVSFYTYRDYIEITDKFNGTMSLPIMGADHNSVFKWLGSPKMKDNSWDAYQMRYGVLVVYFDSTGKINKIQISSKSVETLRLCD